MGVINSHTCNDLDTKVRIGVYLRTLFPELPTNAGIKKAIKNNRLLLNGGIANSGDWVNEGDEIELTESGFTPPKDFKLKLEVIYEDEFMAAVIKLPGYSVNGNTFKTIENTLNFNLKKSTEPDALEWPRPVHRLDNPTSGILLIAKTSRAAKGLGQQFKDKKIAKTYRALVQGTTTEKGVIRDDIEGLEALTEFRRIGVTHSLANTSITDVELYPKTGRKHQLRIHMASQGHAIIGDKLHGIEGKVLQHKGLFLYAVAISFHHPVSGKEVSLKMDLPLKYQAYIDRERMRWEKYNS